MLVSVIIPAYKADQTLRAGLSSVEAAMSRVRLHGINVEAIIAADDGQPDRYKPLESAHSFVRVVAGGKTATGPSRARNRAIAVANGDFFAMLDADDAWSPNYLEQLVPMARSAGAAFGRTEIVKVDGTQLDIFPRKTDQQELTLEDLGFWSASFHPLMTRALLERNVLDRAQDVWSAAVTIAKLGGSAPLAATACYQLHLRDGSMTTEDVYCSEVDRSYARLAKLALSYKNSPPGLRSRLQNMWRQKSTHNKQFMHAQRRRAEAGRSLWPSFYHWRSAQT